MNTLGLGRQVNTLGLGIPYGGEIDAEAVIGSRVYSISEANRISTISEDSRTAIAATTTRTGISETKGKVVLIAQSATISSTEARLKSSTSNTSGRTISFKRGKRSTSSSANRTFKK